MDGGEAELKPLSPGLTNQMLRRREIAPSPPNIGTNVCRADGQNWHII